MQPYSSTDPVTIWRNWRFILSEGMDFVNLSIAFHALPQYLHKSNPTVQDIVVFLFSSVINTTRTENRFFPVNLYWINLFHEMSVRTSRLLEEDRHLALNEWRESNRESRSIFTYQGRRRPSRFRCKQIYLTSKRKQKNHRKKVLEQKTMKIRHNIWHIKTQ